MHLEELKGICHLSDHSNRRQRVTDSDRSDCKISLSLSLLTFPNSFVSSANFKIELVRVASRSLKKIKIKTMGHKTEPWGTPLVTDVQVDLWPLKHTLCLLPLNHSFSQTQTFPPIPCFSVLSNNLWCGTLSNAFPKSKYITSTLSWLSRLLVSVYRVSSSLLLRWLVYSTISPSRFREIICRQKGISWTCFLLWTPMQSML